MNILILTTSFPCKTANTIGGKFVLHEALAYAKNGAKVKVLTPFFIGAKKYEIIEYGVEVIRFKYFFPSKFQKLVDPVNPLYHHKNKYIKLINIPFFIFSFLLAVFKHSKNIDIVHCQWSTSVLFALPFRWFRKFKIVTTARGSDIFKFPKWLNIFIMKKVDASINCYGEQWFDRLKQFPSKYIKLPLITYIKENSIIPDDLKDIFIQNDKAFKIVYLGRFDEFKIKNSGFPFLMLINSIDKLIHIGYNITLVYIGDGALLNDMKIHVKQLHLEKNIFFTGNKINPEDYLPFFDLGLGGANTDAVIQEMSVIGLPQVSVNSLWYSNVPWVDKENMFLFTPDDNDSLTESITFAIDNPEVLKTVSENIKNDIKDYVLGYDEGGKEYITAFEELLKT